MKEVEVKARVKDRTTLLAALTAAGITLSDPISQDDTIYALHSDTEKFIPGAVFVRIRIEQKISPNPSFEKRGVSPLKKGDTGGFESRAIFNLKKSQSNELDSLEHETEVADVAELRQILRLIGFHISATVKKSRQKAQFEGYELCLDEVAELGDFIELEKLTTDEADSGEIQAELFGVLERFGVSRSEQITRGYDSLMILQGRGQLPWSFEPRSERGSQI